MKFHSEKHKSKIIKKASKYLPKDKLNHAATFYETFGANYFSPIERWHLVE